MNKLILLTALFVTLSACKSTKDASRDSPNSVRFALDRGPCFGKCPVYSLKIYSNGLATYEGRPFAKKLGKYEKHLDRSEVKKLDKAFKDANFFDFQDVYVSEIIDLPMVKIYYNNGKQSKSVEGKEDRPAKLLELQFMLEKIAESEDWQLVQAYKSNEANEDKDDDEDSFIYSEIIIEPADGVRLPLWFKEKEQYGIRLKTKLAPDGNLWLITYDVSRFAPEEIIQMLKNDPSILQAQFNKKINNRSEE